jgi:RNA 2',3'-cyclic 3'-phosphodiesterase
VRLFLAIELEPNARTALVDAIAPLRAAAPTVRWTPDAQLHLTLRFLGEQPPDVADRVGEGVGRVARAHLAFPIEIAGLGAFPDRRRPRVVWAGVAREPRLELLYHDVEVACVDAGVPVEGRAFRPHVTIGRADRIAPAELPRLDRAARDTHLALTSHVDSVHLMRSDLTARGARHSRVASAPLGAI